MAQTQISDIRHFLDDGGGLPADLPGPTARVALHLTSIVEAATVRPAGLPAESAVRCRRRPRHRPCAGYLRVLRTDVPEEIAWTCPHCGDEGLITGWRRTHFDLSMRRRQDPQREPDEIGALAVVPYSAYRALREAEGLDPAARCTLAMAEPAGREVAIEAPSEALDHLLDCAEVAWEREPRASRRRQIEVLAAIVAEALDDDGWEVELPEVPGTLASEVIDAAMARLDPGRRRARHPGVVQLKITLQRVSPPVWRRVLVPADFTLEKLHETIQTTMGWSDSHLHEFEVGGLRIGPADPELTEFDVVDERKTRLGDLVTRPSERFLYTYDFGDDWRHEILVEEVSPAGSDASLPRLIDGRGDCPAEDSGGGW